MENRRNTRKPMGDRLIMEFLFRFLLLMVCIALGYTLFVYNYPHISAGAFCLSILSFITGDNER